MTQLSDFVSTLFVSDQKSAVGLQDMYSLYCVYNIGKGVDIKTLPIFDIFVESLIWEKYEIKLYNAGQLCWGLRFDPRGAARAKYRINEVKDYDEVYNLLTNEKIAAVWKKILEDREKYDDDPDEQFINAIIWSVVETSTDVMSTLKRDEYILIEKSLAIKEEKVSQLKYKSEGKLLRYASDNKLLFSAFHLKMKTIKNGLSQFCGVNVDTFGKDEYIPKEERKNVSDATRRAVWDKYASEDKKSSQCFCCRITVDYFTWECAHIKAKSRGGSNTIENLRVCCIPCNRQMGTTNPYTFCITKGFPPPDL